MAHFLAGIGGDRPMGLKKAVQKKRIIEYNIDEYLNKFNLNAAERMRQLDLFRLHAPVPEECTLLNIPDDRLNLSKLSDILLLCGGNQGVRFSTTNLMDTKKHIGENDAAWAKVSAAYEVLTTAERKLALESLEASRTETETETYEKLKTFHALCDEFLAGVSGIIALVRAKHGDLAEIVEHPEYKVAPDPEKSLGFAKPEWLTTLMDKCSAHLESINARNAATATAASENGGTTAAAVPPANKTLNLTVGVLAAYLSGCSTGVFSCDTKESDALSWLLQASNDTTANVSISDMSRGMGAAIPHLSREYFAHRFYNFLSTMTELKSTPKAQSSLEKFDELM